jgi:hypothetical protein
MGREPGKYPSLGTERVQTTEPLPEDQEAAFVATLLEQAFPRAKRGTFKVKRSGDKVIVEFGNRQVEVKLSQVAGPVTREQAIDMLKRYKRDVTERAILETMSGRNQLGMYDARGPSGKVGGKTMDVYGNIHSLHNHAYPSSAQHSGTRVANWVKWFSLQAPNGGNSYTFGGMFLDVRQAGSLPPAATATHEAVSTPHVETFPSGWASSLQQVDLVEGGGLVPQSLQSQGVRGAQPPALPPAASLANTSSGGI